MTLELKEYQQRASDRLDVWLEMLHEERLKSEDNLKQLPDAIGPSVRAQVANYPNEAWKALAERRELPDSVLERGARYTPRTTGSDEPLPHVCLKIPTGGGKTLMGAVAIERILMRRQRQTGLVLWIVPTHAIYAQTKSALWNREHPYRQRLELACGGRVKVMEKDDALTKQDINDYLCVMLLMLPAANRCKNRDFLRMFRDAGRYPGFFPEDGDALEEGKFIAEYPSLDRDQSSRRVKHSLFNVIKVSRPIVILDEAHKAYGGGRKLKDGAAKYARSISRMDPSIVVELTATPNSNISNLLVDVTGSELHDEQMIKLPVQVRTPVRGAGWQHTLTVAREQLEALAVAANTFEAESGRYIRPIAVVRAENTGKSQRDGSNIHVDDVREELIKQGVDPSAIKVKSAEVDELGREDLVNARERSAVQWILTKDALKEGWDCPFAYVLVLLDRTKAENAVTQLVGRVMRMPHVESTEVKELDQCYVICHNADVRRAVDKVRDGLQNEGMGDLGQYVNGQDTVTKMTTIRIKRRDQFRGLSIYLPKVLCRTPDGAVRDLDYDRDILAGIDWSRLRIDTPQAILSVAPTGGQATVGPSGEVLEIEDCPEPVDDDNWLGYFTHHLSSLIPNPWVCARIVKGAIEELESAGSTTRTEILARRSTYAEQFRRYLFGQIDSRSKDRFTEMLDSGEISFDLETSEGNYEVCEECDEVVRENEPLLSMAAKTVQSSLFKPVLNRDFNEYERKFAYCMEGKKAISWWYRVAASQRSGYYLRGWRRDRVFPDFVALATPSGELHDYDRQFLFFETKGAHLKDHEDSKYKKCLMDVLEATFNDDLAPRGYLRIREGELKGAFRMVIQGQEHEALAGTWAGELP